MHEDKGNIESAITFGISQLEDKWGIDQSCQIIIITNTSSLTSIGIYKLYYVNKLFIYR